MSEQRIVVERPNYEAAALRIIEDVLEGLPNTQREYDEWARRIVDAALAGARIVELPDMEKLREVMGRLDRMNAPNIYRPGVESVLAAARWVLSLESE